MNKKLVVAIATIAAILIAGEGYLISLNLKPETNIGANSMYDVLSEAFSPFANTSIGSSTVGTVGVDVVAPRTARKYAAFTNDSDSDIYLFLTASTSDVVGKGILLNANGGSYEITSSNLWTGYVSAISSGTNLNLTYTEGY